MVPSLASLPTPGSTQARRSTPQAPEGHLCLSSSVNLIGSLGSTNRRVTEAGKVCEAGDSLDSSPRLKLKPCCSLPRIFHGLKHHLLLAAFPGDSPASPGQDQARQ